MTFEELKFAPRDGWADSSQMLWRIRDGRRFRVARCIGDEEDLFGLFEWDLPVRRARSDHPLLHLFELVAWLVDAEPVK